ncbi:MAG: flagellar hook-basal body complex protein [Planctomycetota bacterium]|nr:flagellar hook-basal body complex protein [Planctomycetota bacterium]
MGLTSALFTGLSGLNASQFQLDVIGDNIANVNTTAFKSSRTLFQTQFARTLTSGTKPNDSQGGTNPSQVGLGVVIGTIQRSFSPGALETTGLPSDLAIEGKGFFVLRSPENERVFTRDGTFTLSADNRLINQDGFLVQGFGINDDFQLIPGALRDLDIPIGELTTARATTDAKLDGTLNSTGTIATQGTILQSQLLHDAVANPITAATDLTVVRNPGGAPLLATGDTITINGIKKGGRDVPSEQFVVGTTGTTVGDFLAWMDEVIGIQNAAGVPGTPGTAVNAGMLEIRGNVGTENGLSIQIGTLLSNGTTQLPFSFSETQAANGESGHTSFLVFDSLGTPISVGLTMVLETRAATSTWRFYAEAEDDTDVMFDVGTGTIEFDANGQFITAPSNGVVINRVNSGATEPLQFELDFTAMSGLAVPRSSLVMSFQDGFSTGTLIEFNVGDDGLITGTFSNGLLQTIGQLAVSTFANPSGLIARSNSIFFVGPNSGEARITAPLTLGAGRIKAGTLELSNVDLSREFISLITTSTAFSAASRVISTSDQLLQELLLIIR